MRNTFITVLLLIFTACFAKAQMLDIDYEKQALFQGNDATLFAKWVTKRINYPDICIQDGIEGTVFVQFLIEPSGQSLLIVGRIQPKARMSAARRNLKEAGGKHLV